MTIRHDWTRPEIREIYESPLLDLVYRAATVHRQHQPAGEVQRCTLLSIKTGGCPEDCAYCSQSVHASSPVPASRLLPVEHVAAAARDAREAGSTRLCMGAAWREVRDNRDFDRVLEMVRAAAGSGLEVCCTLGLLTAEQAEALRDAGLTAYNHNLDTSPEFYGEIVSTRTYEERRQTLELVSHAGLAVCCGGIVGMGEDDADRISLLAELARLDPHPESVPINALVAVEGTPLEGAPPVDPLVMVRMVATARILMPRSRVRLSAGRGEMSETAQALCFLAGANSVFAGERLLTTPNPPVDSDDALFARLGLRPAPPG